MKNDRPLLCFIGPVSDGMYPRILSDPGKYILESSSALLTPSQSCDASDDNCLCKNETVVAIRDCQQCMFNFFTFIFHSFNNAEITGMYAELIKKNEKMPDPRAGSTPVLSGMCIPSPSVRSPY